MRLNGVRNTPPPCRPVTMNLGAPEARLAALLPPPRWAVMNVVEVAPGKLHFEAQTRK
jgi:hypothetical protein